MSISFEHVTVAVRGLSYHIRLSFGRRLGMNS